MMKCSECGAEGLCWYNAQRRLVCRECRDKAQRDAWRAQVIGKQCIWHKSGKNVISPMSRDHSEDIPVTVIDTRKGWLIVRDEAGNQHRVRYHNTTLA